jgi:hypothetical protein
MLAASVSMADQAALAYPGHIPGPARSSASVRSRTPANDSISIGFLGLDNDILDVKWELIEDGLGPLFARDMFGLCHFPSSAEAFIILLADGHSYAASKLKLEGKPLDGVIADDPAATTLAARISGRQVEARFRSTDGRLRVVWRAILRNGANYIRQQIEVTALNEDCQIKEIVWHDAVVSDIKMAGRVDGSPIVSGNFFFGCEDPMALNTFTAAGLRIGAWTPADLKFVRRQRKIWNVNTSWLRAGDNEFTFRYDRGPHRLDIWGAVLMEDGRVIARDDHHGWTGTAPMDNVFSFAIPKVKSGAHYALLAHIGSDPALKLPANGHVDSYGSVEMTAPTGSAFCRLQRNASLKRGETLTQSFVLGVAPPKQMRRAFLYYLERERAHPFRPFLHYNSWYDIAWDPFAMNETNCLDAIRTVGERFVKPHGAIVDSMVFDDGWDNPKTLWQFHAGFPHGFAPLAAACREYSTRLGVWLSPFGGYGVSKDQRIKFGSGQGYETNAVGFSLAGAKYYAAFKQSCVDMIRKYGVNHFKFDGIAAGMYASGGGQYILDTEAMRRLMLELRQEDPNLYINLTTGSWPSPFWLRYADSLWRQGNDMDFTGKGSKQQQWITYRDQETYRNVVKKGPLYPLNSLMTQGVAYSRHGTAGESTFNSSGFKDDVRAFFGSGTGLQELYIQPDKLTERDWAVLAEGAKWSRANADVLVDTHWIGGDPGKTEVYGWAAWSPRKGIVTLRNPDDQPRRFALNLRMTFEMPLGAPTRYSLKSPWTEHDWKPALVVDAGKPVWLILKPFEVVSYDAIPFPLSQ